MLTTSAAAPVARARSSANASFMVGRVDGSWDCAYRPEPHGNSKLTRRVHGARRGDAGLGPAWSAMAPTTPCAFGTLLATPLLTRELAA